MNLRIESKEQMKYILSTALNQYEDCVININKNISIISNRLSDNKILLSLRTGTKSIGNVVENNSNHKMQWVNDYFMKYLDDDISDIELEVNIKQDVDNLITDINIDDEYEDIVDDYGFYDIVDYREDYMLKHNNMRIRQKPISVNGMKEVAHLFSRFLVKDNCDKLIFSFSTYIHDLNHTFILDLVIDKLYVYGRTLISFIVTRPDMGDIEFTNPSDCIFEYRYKDKANNKELVNILKKHIATCFTRCDLVSNHNKVNINAYSNINFKEN